MDDDEKNPIDTYDLFISRAICPDIYGPDPMEAIISAISSVLSFAFIGLGVLYYTVCRNFKQRM